ncbi:hypothetical protein BBO99_00008010 [Phytophthora kernoviae]|uniref:SKI-interacting protein SKIP SNW domain-containing protein n=2 Tax=Phytophthora kernoviae TaxID=325452 RepID=A0A3R7KQT7_9STRA|nr:hypothetical protein G195_011347 [Phytophthora kernoviae 00238/432]KAG2505203.1 hypothetical protein JM18_009495 [Phytophthora kernoviae]RLN26394.1 hypothetical protein BBI17_009586 [Phytophthora kernoviae]RLN75846.1 hypothetical protein BBO99_00008010 [Phytophthora kernoviae]
MSALFPAPVRSYTTFSDASAASTSSSSSSLPSYTTSVPKYPLRVKQQFVPRRNEDFGDGGAYPELHIAQFPLGMGKKKGTTSAGGTLALQVRGQDGAVSYDAIVTQQHRDKTKVYTKFSDIVEKDGGAAALALPTKDEELETANRTKDALQKLVLGKVASSLPVNISRQKSVKETAKYIRYTPNEQVEGAPKQRIIRMVDVAKDPMEPPKFQHTKAVRGPPSPPVPVLHSPPRKLTVADQQSWKIPPCISNWKNSKGFTIALDKRLAADGRGLQQVTVNDNFASLSEALAIAERKAREEVNMRAQVQKKLAMKQKEQKENELRELASKARMERAGIRADDEEEDRGRDRRHRSSSAHSDRRRSYSDDEDGDSDAEGRRERDRIRQDRKKEREREMRMEKLGKKGKLARDQDRDVSEKIALGQLQGGGKAGGSDAMFDSRLFNQSQGISSGFGQEDEYNVYSKPMVDRGKASVYRPKGDDGAIDADKEYEDLKGGHTKRFKADKQFRGTEAVAHGGGRDGPVQFSYDTVKDEDDEKHDNSRAPESGRRESRQSPPRSPQQSKDRTRSASGSPPRSRGRDRSPDGDRKRRRRSPSEDSDDDPFGLDQFLTDARKGADGKSRRSPGREGRRR